MLTKTDEQLIKLALQGSERSWVNLVRRYEGLVYNHCLRMTGGATEAMDLMQEVFLTVYRSLPSYRGENRFKGWLMKIASNKAVDYLRHRERNPQHFADDFDEDTCNPYPVQNRNEPDYQYAQADTQKQIRSMLQKLPTEQRLVVELKFFQHFTFDEIGLQLNLPVNTIKSRLYAALNKLKDQMEKQHVL